MFMRSFISTLEGTCAVFIVIIFYSSIPSRVLVLHYLNVYISTLQFSVKY